jgi:hypothetical protein
MPKVALVGRMAPIVPRPLAGSPLLYVPWKGGLVVASDVHVGLARQEGQIGGIEAGSPESLAQLIISGARSAKAKRVLLLGDVKEPIVGGPKHVKREVGEFFWYLEAAGLAVEVCPGNHDVGLRGMVSSGITFHPIGGLLCGTIGFFHGHAWPSPDIMNQARTLVAGHLHPGLRLAQGKPRCWVRARLPEGRSTRSKPSKRPDSVSETGVTEVIVVPALNPLCANESLNQEKPRRGRSFLVRRFLSAGEVRAYLLDGTDMGRLRLSP